MDVKYLCRHKKLLRNTCRPIICLSVYDVTAELVPTSDPPQFCPHEVFNATCSPGHVVLMTSAFYGRMRTGRCIRTDTFIGCRTDVLAFMDRKCSGRTACNVDVSSSELFAMQNCPKDLYAYLEATYECVERKLSNGNIRCIFACVSSPSGPYVTAFLIVAWYVVLSVYTNFHNTVTFHAIVLRVCRKISKQLTGEKNRVSNSSMDREEVGRGGLSRAKPAIIPLQPGRQLLMCLVQRTISDSPHRVTLGSSMPQHPPTPSYTRLQHAAR